MLTRELLQLSDVAFGHTWINCMIACVLVKLNNYWIDLYFVTAVTNISFSFLIK